MALGGDLFFESVCVDQEPQGRVVNFYNSFGDYHAIVIAELPDNEAAAAIAIAAGPRLGGQSP